LEKAGPLIQIAILSNIIFPTLQ